MALVVHIKHKDSGNEFWLRSTTWAFSKERASKFETYGDALKAIANAMRFYPPRKFATIYTTPTIVEE
jgi:hypothetical protein